MILAFKIEVMGTGFFVYLFVCFVFLGAHPWHMDVPRLEGPMGTTAASPYHSNAGSEPHLQPIPQLTATLDP